jgi:hypothetical protein
VASSRKAQCALFYREGLPSMERAVHVIQRKPCQGRVPPWNIEQIHAQIARARETFARLCSTPATSQRDARSSVMEPRMRD